jgi:predicted dehydrogenase
MASQTPVAVGLIGCGNISNVYLEVAQTLDAFRIVACADVRREAAETLAQRFGIPRVCTVDELLAAPDIEIVLNLTTPEAHGSLALAALEAGKSVYNEKPLAMTRAEAQCMLDLARARNLRVGGAPDTFLGGGLQTCRALIDAGAIGTPVGANAFMMSRGHEHWHPNPAFYYKPGGGPLFDMGPYYLTALVALLGPVRSVSGMTRITRAERTITSQPHYGEKIAVEVPTHVAALLGFESGPIGMLMTTFDVQSSALPWIEIYGTEATLSAPDPNTFGGPVRLRRAGEETWQAVEIALPYTKQSRGLGLADMATAIRTGRPHRAGAELTYHVLDLMHAVHEAAESGRQVELQSRCPRPDPL